MGSAATICTDCSALLTPPDGQVLNSVSDIASQANILMSKPLKELREVTKEEEASKSVARALLLKLLERLRTCLRTWGHLERIWVWSIRDALVEEDSSWLPQFAQQARSDCMEDFKGIRFLVEEAHRQRRICPWDALRLLGSLGRNAASACASIGDRLLGLISQHAVEAAEAGRPAEAGHPAEAGLSGGQLRLCLEMLLDAGEALGAAGAIGGRRAIVGLLCRKASGPSYESAQLRGELFWALEARATVATELVAAGVTSAGVVALPAAAGVSQAEGPSAWARVALEELLRNQPADIELGLLRQATWVRDMERGELAAGMQPSWGEKRAFGLAIWPPEKRCLGLRGKLHEAVSRASSKNAPMIIQCACVNAEDGQGSSSAASSGAALGTAPQQQAGSTSGGILLKRDIASHFFQNSAQPLSLSQEHRVGQMMRLLEHLVWEPQGENEYMKDFLEREGLTPEDVRTTYVIAMTGPNTCMVEFIDGACTLKAVRAGGKASGWGFSSGRPERPLHEFLRHNNKDKDQEEKAKKRLAFTAAMSAVLSFAAGLGDRHHENFMITDAGTLLHVDYGYALGREPLDSVVLHRLSRTQRPVTTLHLEELADALPPSDLNNIFWPVVRGAFLRIRAHSGLMLEMVYTAMLRDDMPQQRTWKEAQEFVADRLVTVLPEEMAERFIFSLLWHCGRPEQQYGTQLRDDLKNFREVGLQDKTLQAVTTAYEGVAAGGRRAASAVGGLFEASSNLFSRTNIQAIMQPISNGEEQERKFTLGPRY
jgi:hypothetical protein